MKRKFTTGWCLTKLLFLLARDQAIVETKAKGFQEHISFESTAFKEHGWDLTKQYISVGETPADSRSIANLFY